MLFFNNNLVKAELFSFDGSWQFLRSDFDEEGQESSYTQRYGLGWSPRVTRAIAIDATMNYSKTDSSDDSRRESFSPSATLQVDNDLFLAEINGLINSTSNSKSFDQDYLQWDIFLASNWDYNFWPSLSYNFGKSSLSDDELVHITDTSRKWSEFTGEWEYDNLILYYSYYNDIRNDFVQQSRFDETKHFGRAEYSRNFFDDRLNFNGSGQVIESKTDFTSTDTSGANIEVRVSIAEGLVSIDSTPEVGRLDAVPSLVDGNRNSVAFTIQPLDDANIGVRADLRKVDRLYVYTGPIDQIFISQVRQLQWALYSSNDGFNWELEDETPLTLYNEDDFRYEIETGGLEKIYIKLVAVEWPSTLPLNCTEIEAIRVERGGNNIIESEETFTRILGDVNLRYMLSETMSITYGLLVDDTKFNIGNDTHRIFHTGGFRWNYNDYFTPSLTINSTTTKNDISETKQRSYSLNVKSILLPTLETNTAFTRYENEIDDERTSTNHSFNFNVIAELYPNLDTTIDVIQNYQEDETSDSISDNLNVRWTITARLRSSLLVDFTLDHGTSDVELDEPITNQDQDSSGTEYNLDLNWRPSDLVSILASGSKGTGDESFQSERYLFDASLSLLRTSKTHVIVGYKFNSNDDKTLHSLNGTWNWNLSEYLTLQTRAGYLFGDDQSWSILTRLSSRLSI